MTSRPRNVDSARWQQVKSLVHAALEHPGHARDDFLAGACGNDCELRDEVRSLLAAEDSGFLDQPAFAEAARTREAQRTSTRMRIDAWRIVRELGRGGMGTVYLAERDDGEYRTQAAVKVIRPDMSSAQIVRRFRTERQILADLHHPNIARLLDGGTTEDGLPYFVIEYVEGQPIDQYCEQRRLNVNLRLALFRDVCAAVQYAHQHLVVHRDIKPANVLVTEAGVVKLLDFGIARVLESPATAKDGQTGESPATTQHAPIEPATTLHAMTPEYASPEQRARQAVTTLSDVWSLGVLLYELLTGVHPRIDGEPERPSVAARNTSPVLAGTLNGDLDNIVLMAMRAEPERRYASVAALAEDVRRLRDGLPVTARADTFSYRTAKFIRRNRISVAAAVIVLLNLVGGIINTSWQARQARLERQRAETRFGEVRQLATSFLFELDSLIAPLPGATPAREVLVRRALNALDGLARDATNAASDVTLLRDLAAAYQRVGDVQGRPYSANLGHTEDALSSYRKAIALLERLRRGLPHDQALMHDHARVLQLASAVQARAGDVNGGVAVARHAVSLCDSALATVPTDTAFRAQLAENLVWLARALYQKHSLLPAREAAAVYRRASAMHDSLARLTPNDPMRRYALAVAEAYEAYGLWDLGDLTGDTSYFRDALGHLEASFAGMRVTAPLLPARIDIRRASIDALHEMAQLHVKLGEDDAALRELREALPTTVALAGVDLHNAEAQRDLAALHTSFATAYASAHEWSAAVASARTARGILDRLHIVDSTSTDDAQSRSELAAIEARARIAAGDARGALRFYEQASALARKWARSAPASDGPLRLLAAHDASIAAMHALLVSTSGGARDVHRASECAAINEAVAQWNTIEARGQLAPADSAPAHQARIHREACVRELPRGA